MHSSWARGRYDPWRAWASVERSFADQGARQLNARLPAAGGASSRAWARQRARTHRRSASLIKANLVAILLSCIAFEAFRRDPTQPPSPKTSAGRHRHREGAEARSHEVRHHHARQALSDRPRSVPAATFRRAEAVPIPKKSGGVRVLGVPTSDRIAQTAVRCGSSHGLTRSSSRLLWLSAGGNRRWRRSLHPDVAGTKTGWWSSTSEELFDNLDHSLLMTAAAEPWILLAHRPRARSRAFADAGNARDRRAQALLAALGDITGLTSASRPGHASIR